MSDNVRSKAQMTARFAFLRVPLFRLLAINLVAGMAVAALLVGDRQLAKHLLELLPQQ
jgi:hypothetical protein